VLIDDDDVIDPIAELERMDRFFDGEEPGEVPLEILREKGLRFRRIRPATRRR